MSEINPTDIRKLAGVSREFAQQSDTPISIRVSPHSYVTALLLSTFVSAFLFYISMDAAGVVVFALSWILIPSLALNDKVTFDGRRLSRTGFVPRSWAWFNAARRSLKITDIEQVETQAIRAIKRGGNVYYRYRTLIKGKGLSVAIASGGADYRRMVHGVVPLLAENVLDTRTCELRDHLADPKNALLRAEVERIPSAAALRHSFSSSRTRERRTAPQDGHFAQADASKADELRSLANELRISGYFLQALEAFRRALIIRPADGRLLFEFGRCLHSFAGAERDPALERRALAALRLSERHADGDVDLLTRLGETYFQTGDWRRAGNVFQNVLDRIGDNFRAARGMAEIALHDGKIAHVIHHFSAANRVAETPSLRRWSKNEADYFAQLNSDADYMELEISRVNLLETVERSKKTALRITLTALPAVFVGVIFDDDLIANIGWAVSGVAILVWTGLVITAGMLATRIPYDLVESDD